MSELANVTLSVMALREADLFTRIEAASLAGFGYIGIRLSDYQTALEYGYSVAQIDEELDKHNLRVREIEFERQWVGQDNNVEYRHKEEAVLEMAHHFKARHINMGVFEDRPLEAVAASFSRICKAAADLKLLAQIEFMPYTPPINRLSFVRRLVEDVNQPNGKLLLDTWHLARTAGSKEEFLDLPLGLVSCIQLSETRVRPMKDTREEARHYREVPGEGSGNTVAWLTLMRQRGLDVPFSVEVMSDSLDRLPAQDAALQVGQGVLKVLKVA